MNTVSWAAIAAAWGILVAGAAGVMKTTDLVRSFITEHVPVTLPDYCWIVVPFGVGVFTCLTSHLNPLVTFAPALAHTYGEVLSGIALGAIASPLHHGTALLSAKSKAVATDSPLPVGDDPEALAAQQAAIDAATTTVPPVPDAPATPPDASAP